MKRRCLIEILVLSHNRSLPTERKHHGSTRYPRSSTFATKTISSTTRYMFRKSKLSRVGHSIVSSKSNSVLATLIIFDSLSQVLLQSLSVFGFLSGARSSHPNSLPHFLPLLRKPLISSASRSSSSHVFSVLPAGSFASCPTLLIPPSRRQGACRCCLALRLDREEKAGEVYRVAPCSCEREAVTSG